MSNNKPGHCIAASTLLLAFVALPQALYAQAVSMATVTGRVTDQSGALVTGAQIGITAVDTGTIHNAVTNSEGLYTIPSLPIGAYTFQAAAPGFQTYVQTGLLLRVNDNVQIDVTMRVGQAVEKVEVQANASMVQTQQNTIPKSSINAASSTCRSMVAIPRSLSRSPARRSITAMEPTPAVRASSAHNPSPSPAARATQPTTCSMAETTTTALPT